MQSTHEAVRRKQRKRVQSNHEIPVLDRLTLRAVPIDWYVTQLQWRIPIVLSRWSDGEWPCILGEVGENVDHHPYSEELRTDLIRVIRDRPTYTTGLQRLLVRNWGPAVQAWLARENLRPDWVAGDVFHDASVADRLGPLIEILRQRGVILVGPARLAPLTIFPIRARIETPLVNCHTEWRRIVDETQRAIGRVGPEPVVSVSASMSANVIVHYLHAVAPRQTILDLGSLWEPYAGHAIRKYQRDIVARLRTQGVG